MSTASLPIIVIKKQDEVLISAKWDKDTISLGRGQSNDIPLASPDKGVSRQHMRLEKREGGYYVIDVKSRNGIFVNGLKIDSHDSYQVHEGDKIEFGEYTLSFYQSIESLPLSISGEMEAATSEHLAPEILSTSFLVRKEKLALLSDMDKSIWGTRAYKAKSRSYLLFFLIIAGIATSFFLLPSKKNLFTEFFSKNENKEEQEKETPPPTEKDLRPVVRIYTVIPENKEPILNAVGYVRAKRQVQIKPAIAGKIDLVMVKQGQKIQKNQILAKLNQSDTLVQIQIAQTKMDVAQQSFNEIKEQFRNAQEKYRRSKKLHGKGFISDNKLEEDESAYKALGFRGKKFAGEIKAIEQEIELFKNTLNKAEIRAPFDGVVLDKKAEVGFQVSPKDDILFVLIDRSSMRVKVDVNEVYASQIAKKQRAELSLTAYPNRKYQGRVNGISPNVDSVKGTVNIEVEIVDANDLVLPGMSAKVKFLKAGLPEKEGFAIPASAIWQKGEEKLVWLVQSGKLQSRSVRVYESSSLDQVYVQEGISPNDKVVVFPEDTFEENQAVKVIF